MKYCSKCGNQILDEAIVCPNCGCGVADPIKARQINAYDEVSAGLCILSFLIPLFGIIYWPLKHKETPKKAQACGITALISWALGIFISLIAMGI